jgi:hypothetical protein
LNSGYCLSVVCMFVLGILSCGEVIIFDCVVIHTPTDHDHVWHLWVVPVVPRGHRIKWLWFLYNIQWVFGQF